MIDDGLVRGLFDQLCALPTVDAHEHLHSEELRVGRQVDIFLLFHQYLFTQLIAAGMDPDKAQALDGDTLSLEQKWEAVAPYLDLVRTCGCARPPFAALSRFFGEADLTADNYAELTRRMQEHNRPGLFEHCLREACNIVLVLNQNRTMWQTDLFRPILPEDRFAGNGARESLEGVAQEAGAELPATLPGFVEIMESLLTRRVEEGMLGVKAICLPYQPGDPATAPLAYRHVLGSGGEAEDRAGLNAYLRDQLYEMCGRLEIVVVEHSGVWSGGWADHTNIRPTNILPVALAHRRTRFDLFHAGTPWPADAGLIARGMPNVWLNLCWSHLISPVMAEQALDIWLDMAPVNRYFAFGGDYWWAVENVYGALMQTREIVARVLARRIRDRSLTEKRAMQIARRWFHDNPREVYRV